MSHTSVQDPEVLAKRDVAVEWCRHATPHAASYGGKPWTYLLIPHDAIAENMTTEGLAQHYLHCFLLELAKSASSRSAAPAARAGRSPPAPLEVAPRHSRAHKRNKSG
jgi:hypothetical protein